MVGFKEGFAFFKENAAAFAGVDEGGTYVDSVNAEIEFLAKTLNEKFSANNAGIEQLKGNVAEFWDAGTFNINAAVKGSVDRAYVLESTEYGSVDVRTDSGIDAGSKFYKSAMATLKQQAKNAQESYHDYQINGGKASFEAYCSERQISDPNAAVYSGQVRLVPAEQLEEVRTLLQHKIATEEMVRPEQVQRYKDTIEMLSDRLKNSEGVESVPLDTTTAKDLARLAKENSITDAQLKQMGLSTEEMIDYGNILSQAMKASLTAATISVVLKIAPEIYKAISYLIKRGEIQEGQLKQMGILAISGSAEGFVRGAVAAAVTASCKAGLFGEVLKGINPSIVGAITVVIMNAFKNSFDVACGKKTKSQLAEEMVRDMFVSTCSLALGTITAAALSELPVLAPFGFLIGSLVGSVVSSFTYSAGRNVVVAFCVESGFTMFGLVEQDYTLPDEVLKEIGVNTFDYESFMPESFNPESFAFDSFEVDSFNADSLGLTYLHRGVIGIARVGYC